jgi:hypothetical protein
MHHTQAPSIDRPQFITPNPLMKPNLLKQALGRSGAASFTQAGSRVRAFAPFFVKAGIKQSHLRSVANQTLAKSRI